MKVVFIQGASGTGKSTLIHELAKEGFNVIHEDYYKSIHPLMQRESLASKWSYVGNWFIKLYEQIEKDPHIIFSDRNPNEACFYAKNGNIIQDSINKSISELHDYFEIEFFSVLLFAPFDILRERIQNRKSIEWSGEYKKYATKLKYLNNSEINNFYNFH